MDKDSITPVHNVRLQMCLVELWLLKKNYCELLWAMEKLLWIVDYEKVESRLVEQLWLMKKLLSAIALTSEPHMSSIALPINLPHSLTYELTLLVSLTA
jgi:hypothetical protein